MRHELSSALVIPELYFSEEASLLFRPVTCLSGCFCSSVALGLLTPGIIAGSRCQAAAKENEHGAKGDSRASRGYGLVEKQRSPTVPQQEEQSRSGDNNQGQPRLRNH